MTRITGSVPEARNSTLPLLPNSDSAAATAFQTAVLARKSNFCFMRTLMSTWG